MESAESPYYAGGNDNVPSRRRRMAMKLFLSNPLAASEEFYELIDELRVFFLQSSNPHEDQFSGAAVHNREDLFEQWQAAKRWAEGEGDDKERS